MARIQEDGEQQGVDMRTASGFARIPECGSGGVDIDESIRRYKWEVKFGTFKRMTP